MTTEQYKRIAEMADLWNATVSLCSAGFRITARRDGYENMHVLSYTEIVDHHFPADTICDTIQRMGQRLMLKEVGVIK